MRLSAASLALVAVAALALSGCSGSSTTTTSSAPVTVHCPDGVTVTGNATVPSPTCPRRGPKVVLTAVPSNLHVYQNGTFSWHIEAGDHTGGHSMHNAVVLSQFSLNDTSSLKEETTYGNGFEIAKSDHQNLPVNESGEYTFKTPGQYFVRAYARILADDLTESDYWSPEVPVSVADVIPTGQNTVVKHTPGPVMSLSNTSLELHIGDGIIFSNQDVVDHTFTPGPCAESDISAKFVPKGGTSTVVVFKAPGRCVFKTDDGNGEAAQTLTIDVSP